VYIYAYMPSLEKSIVVDLLSTKKEKYPFFIETGTANGDTTFEMEKIFEHIYTIELNELSFINTKNKYSGDKINFYLGDSSEIICDILPNINDNAVFFLDGHYSGGGTAMGKQHVPLYEELISINNFFKHKAIIIIDDYRLFKTLDGGICDWTQINKETCLTILEKRIKTVFHLPSSHHPEDRLIIEINELNE
jgi:hypothetical protein